MKVHFTTLVLAVLFALAGPASSKAKSVADDIRALYDRFVTAQNNRDLDAVRQALSDREDFLWISDGKPFWGREAMIARMASFQEAEVWRVEPDYASAKVVEMSSEAAYLHVPLVLVLGRRESPAKLKWLVEVLCQKSAGEWRISALFTAEDKRARRRHRQSSRCRRLFMECFPITASRASDRWPGRRKERHRWR